MSKISGKFKAAVTQEDLRRLMKQKTDKKRIDSPFCKYNSLGQPCCVVCNTSVKNELLWNAHLLSRTHKENVARNHPSSSEARDHPFSSEAAGVEGLKRKATDFDEIIVKKFPKVSTTTSEISTVPSELPSDFFDQSSKNPTIAKPSTSDNLHGMSTKGTLLTEKYDSSEEESVSVTDNDPSVSSFSGNAVVQQQLPEGFFDDPKLDAKIRNIPYKDKMEEQLELFQKAIKEEATVSEALLEEDDDRREEQRNIDEIDDQLDRWTRINSLAKQKRPVVNDSEHAIKNSDIDLDDVDNDVDSDVDSLCNWRNKMVWN